MRRFPHFNVLLDRLNINGWEEGHSTLTIGRAEFVGFVRSLLYAIPFDEEWYLRTYPDVAEYVAAGKLASGRMHFIEFGYFEGRHPGLMDFDPAEYGRLNPDLAPLLNQEGGVEALRHHFVNHGYREGRRISETL